MTQAARERLRELRARPHNFLSRAQASEGHRLAFEVLDELHADRRLPSFAELEEVATNPHARQGFLDWCQRTRRFALWTQESVAALADHLREGGFARIVELGAGRGDLAWHLTRMGVPVEATDAGAATSLHTGAKPGTRAGGLTGEDPDRGPRDCLFYPPRGPRGGPAGGRAPSPAAPSTKRRPSCAGRSVRSGPACSSSPARPWSR